MICKGCGPGKCHFQNVDIACPVCNETGCDYCSNAGYVSISGCPQNEITADVYNTIRLSDFVKRGILPESGALNDQRNRDMSAVLFFWSESDRADADAIRRASKN